MSNAEDYRNIKCWSCREQFTLGEFRDADGYCPNCDAEQELPGDDFDPQDHDDPLAGDDMMGASS